MRSNAYKTSEASAAPAEAGGFSPGALDAFRDSRLDELARLRQIGIAGAERISRCMQGKATPAEAALLASKDGLFVEFMRTSRAVRQVIVLEMELVGLRPAPDRDAPRGLHAPDAGANDNRGRPGDVLAFGDIGNDYDYNHGPLDEVVARIRKDLRTEAPAEDPFAPRARRTDEPPISKAPAVRSAHSGAPKACDDAGLSAKPSGEPPGEPPGEPEAKPKRGKRSDRLDAFVLGPVVRAAVAGMDTGDAARKAIGRWAAHRAAGGAGRGRGPPG
jgi:hypothetical protein